MYSEEDKDDFSVNCVFQMSMFFKILTWKKIAGTDPFRMKTCRFRVMSDREPTRWQHNRTYPHPINPCVYTYDSRLYCRETVDAHCSNIIKS